MAAPARRLPAPDVPCRLPGPPSVQGMVERQRSEGAVEGVALLEHDSYLPMEMLCKVFEHLDARTLMVVIPAVCRWWREVYYSFATSLDFSWVGYQEDDVLLGMAVKYALGAVVDVNLSGCEFLTEESVVILAQHCTNLRSVDLRRTSMGDTALAALGEFCNKLRVVILDDCLQVTDEGLSSLADGCPNLREVSLRGMHREVRDAGIANLAVSCGQLRKLNLSSCAMLTDATLEAIAENCKFLEELSLAYTNVSSTGLLRLSGECDGLQTLDVSHCRRVTTDAVGALRAACPSLDHVRCVGSAVDDVWADFEEDVGF